MNVGELIKKVVEFASMQRTKYFGAENVPDLVLPDAVFEHCLVELRLKDRKLLIGSLYRVPNSNQQLFLREYKELIDKLKETKSDIIL